MAFLSDYLRETSGVLNPTRNANCWLFHPLNNIACSKFLKGRKFKVAHIFHEG